MVTRSLVLPAFALHLFFYSTHSTLPGAWVARITDLADDPLMSIR